MKLRLLDIHADGCPDGHDECEHWNRELHPGETHTFTMTGHIEDYATESAFLSATRDYDDNVTITVNAFDYQAKALGFGKALDFATHRVTTSATVSEMRPKRSGTSTLLWLTGCFALVGVQAWASLTGNLIVFALAAASLVIAVASRT